MKVVCFGKSPAGNDFEASHGSFDESISKPFQAYLKRCWSTAERRARALTTQEETVGATLPALDGLFRMEDAPTVPVAAPTAPPRHKPKRMKKSKKNSSNPSDTGNTSPPDPGNVYFPPPLDEGYNSDASRPTSPAFGGDGDTPLSQTSHAPSPAFDNPLSQTSRPPSPALDKYEYDPFGMDFGVESFDTTSDVFGSRRAMTPPTTWAQGMPPPPSPGAAAAAARAERGGGPVGATYATIDPALLGSSAVVPDCCAPAAPSTPTRPPTTQVGGFNFPLPASHAEVGGRIGGLFQAFHRHMSASPVRGRDVAPSASSAPSVSAPLLTASCTPSVPSAPPLPPGAAADGAPAPPTIPVRPAPTFIRSRPMANEAPPYKSPTKPKGPTAAAFAKKAAAAKKAEAVAKRKATVAMRKTAPAGTAPLGDVTNAVAAVPDAGDPAVLPVTAAPPTLIYSSTNDCFAFNRKVDVARKERENAAKAEKAALYKKNMLTFNPDGERPLDILPGPSREARAWKAAKLADGSQYQAPPPKKSRVKRARELRQMGPEERALLARSAAAKKAAGVGKKAAGKKAAAKAGAGKELTAAAMAATKKEVAEAKKAEAAAAKKEVAVAAAAVLRAEAAAKKVEAGEKKRAAGETLAKAGSSKRRKTAS
ncbi:hypothetical protein B0H17DRAFT_1218222 [Mycena rosella]|uniref:Uncharacterized protein n=1 Tax=Mycena rosella TaxID=1033263 RepID=A0AAD7BSH2_MYCRO|nr:hypothetical protein B0H17DRAFT_1218222 [Mycena rosella]